MLDLFEAVIVNNFRNSMPSPERVERPFTATISRPHLLKAL